MYYITIVLAILEVVLAKYYFSIMYNSYFGSFESIKSTPGLLK